jgi:hypothetical protein
MRRGLTFRQMTVGLLFGAMAVFACLMPAQGDTFWHLRAGQEIWRTLHVPLDEHYSYTAAGGYWPNHEWLWQAFGYGLYRVGGMRLFELGSAAIIIGACAILYRLCVGSAASRLVLFALSLPLATRAWALRPQLVSTLALAILLWLLVHERHRWLPLLFVVWANAHGAVAMGIAVLAAVAGLAVLRARRGDARDRRRARALVVLTPLCALATLLTPLGFGLWRYVGTSMALSHENGIREWQPTWPDGPFGIIFWALAVAFLGLLFWRRNRLRQLSQMPRMSWMSWMSWGDLVLLTASLVMLVLAARAVRNTCVFLLIAVPAASRLLGADFRFRKSVGRSEAETPDHPRVNLALLVGISALEAAGVLLAWHVSYDGLGWQPISAGALAAVRTCPERVFGRYNDGGPLLWFVPERRVFSDTRQDPYPLAITRETSSIEHGGPYQETFARYGVHCAILPLKSPATERLTGDGWKLTYSDGTWVVLTEGGSPSPS